MLLGRALAIAICLLFVAAARATEPLTHDRMPTNFYYPATPWKGYVGVIGGIPNRTTINTTLGTGSSAAAINAAIAACPSNEVVLLDAGSFSMNDQILIKKDGVTLRGATNANGTPATTLTFTTSKNDLVRIGSAFYNDASDWYIAEGAVGYSTRTVRTGKTRGSTRITVSATPTGLAAQQWMMFSAASQTGVVDGGGFSEWLYPDTNSHPATFIVWTTNVSGTTIDFWPPIQADYWNGTVEIHYRSPADTIELSGIENIKITRSSASITGNSLDFVGTRECWAKNVEATTHPNSDGYFGISHYVDFRTEIRGCNIYGGNYFKNTYYCIRTVQSTGTLWIDNKLHGWPNFLSIFGCNLTAFYGNYITNCPYDPTNWLSQILLMHGAHSSFNLTEHSVIPAVVHDMGSQPGDSHGTVYNGNFMRGWDGNDRDGSKARDVIATAWGDEYVETYSHRKFSVLNSILGKDGAQSVYKDAKSSINAVNGIIRIDSTSSNTFYMRNNYNYVNDAIPASEAYAGAETATVSYLMDSNELGHPRWPPFDPRSPGSANDTNIQAGHRYVWVTNYVGKSAGGTPSDVR